ncbi:MAG: radical SAM protein, partial [Lentisphaerae bacterium]
MHNPIKTKQIVRNTEAFRGTDWFFTSKGEPRGYIQPESLRELWFHTGTLCNLRCPFCFEGSGPGRMRLECPSEEDVAPFIAEAVELGVEKFSFTGGEPFVNPHMFAILQRALQLRPCLVLTNGTEPLRNRLHQLSALKESEHPLSFRISLDSPDPETHERGRGKGNFKLSLRVMQELLNLGFKVSVATLRDPNGGDFQERFQAVFREHGLPADIPVVAFPDLLPPESRPEVPEITEN